jgi:hypothetical protein
VFVGGPGDAFRLPRRNHFDRRARHEELLDRRGRGSRRRGASGQHRNEQHHERSNDTFHTRAPISIASP